MKKMNKLKMVYQKINHKNKKVYRLILNKKPKNINKEWEVLWKNQRYILQRKLRQKV